MPTSLAQLGLGAVVGACVGSASVTAAMRAARLEPFVGGRSHCDSCSTPLGYGLTIPLFSYVRLRGACVKCHARIDPVHPIGEFAGGAIVVSALIATPSPSTWVMIALGFVMLSAATYDAKTMRLPDILTGIIAILAASLAALDGRDRLVEGLWSAGLAFVTLWLVSMAFAKLRSRPGLGFGDVKLVAALALWLGAATSWMIVLAGVLGLVGVSLFHRTRGPFPFGPYIAAGAWGVGLFQTALDPFATT